MFELKYKITDVDIKAINKKAMLFYFVLYLAVAVVGLTVGVIAVVLAPSRLMFVLGIILLVLGGVLLLCALMLLIAPKNFIASAIKPSDDELTVKIDESGIAVVSQAEDMKIPFASVTEVRDKKDRLLVFVGKDVALLIKDAFVAGGGLAELFKFLSARRGGVVNPVSLAAESEEEKLGGSEHDQGEAESAETNAGKAGEAQMQTTAQTDGERTSEADE